MNCDVCGQVIENGYRITYADGSSLDLCNTCVMWMYCAPEWPPLLWSDITPIKQKAKVKPE